MSTNGVKESIYRTTAELVPILVEQHLHKCCINCESFIPTWVIAGGKQFDMYRCEKADKAPPIHILLRGCEMHKFEIPF